MRNRKKLFCVNKITATTTEIKITSKCHSGNENYNNQKTRKAQKTKNEIQTNNFASLEEEAEDFEFQY